MQKETQKNYLIKRLEELTSTEAKAMILAIYNELPHLQDAIVEAIIKLKGE